MPIRPKWMEQSREAQVPQAPPEAERSDEAILAGFVLFIAIILVDVALMSDGCSRTDAAWIALFVVLGPFEIVAALCNWDWIFESAVGRRLVNHLGRFGTRLTILFLGSVVTGIGGVLLRGEGYFKDLW